MKHLTRAAFREQEQRAASSSGIGRTVMLAFIGIFLGAAIVNTMVWQIGRVLVREHVADRWIGWLPGFQITVWVFFIRVIWLALHQQDKE